MDVYRCFTPTVLVKAPCSEWVIIDKTNTLTFDVVALQPDGDSLSARNLTSLMPPKDGPSDTVTYLDVAVETKRFIYVRSYVNDGTQITGL